MLLTEVIPSCPSCLSFEETDRHGQEEKGR